MKKSLLIALLFCLFSSAAFAALKHDTIATRFIQYSDFEEVQTDVYISPHSTDKQKQDLINLVENAKSRIKKVFGSYTASPVIIFSPVPRIRKQYSNNSYGKALLLPFSDSKAYIVIGENGNNLDVIAHELMHAEVFKRVGYLNQMIEIPVWFNEGVAMQVDFREQYENSTMEKSFESLEYGWQFFKGSSEEITQHYSLAKAQIKRWRQNKEPDYLYDFLEAINNGKRFNQLYFQPKNKF